MTEATLRNKISQNLASGSNIKANEHREIENLLVDELFAQVKTRAEIISLVNANALKPERWYNITDAAGGSANIYVFAVTGSSLSGIAANKAAPGKSFNYDLANDTLNEITSGSIWAESDF